MYIRDEMRMVSINQRLKSSDPEELEEGNFWETVIRDFIKHSFLFINTIMKFACKTRSVSVVNNLLNLNQLL